jgi:hypothetical protein
LLTTETKQIYTLDGVRYVLNAQSDCAILLLIDKVREFHRSSEIGQPYAVWIMDNKDEIRICRVTDSEFNVYYKNKEDL